ncbi:unnamed protein product, partial [Anisakis simplex]|uniref:Uncharacterized protein n=1 Tax=Anisakis simplex TaxID=6269 RepID=A0A0M3JIY9_ANISI
AQPPCEKAADTNTSRRAAKATTPAVPAAEYRGTAAGASCRGSGTRDGSIPCMRTTSSLVPSTQLFQAATAFQNCCGLEDPRAEGRMPSTSE